ncbi:MAG TPA: heavy metal-associated domain-containing protein [Methylomusa anaerophila]|uniref:Copper chaperone CopZ n=1 Tax=Methylomusa anaerophila TaxID=1930071 RepID=A0A348APM8_9FIRM|nr:heavy metal-associated domain-containing protein [Methylomusa anaerophila]BBB93026.1 copper chaperone CopZ [Methylomusa anaerophila]HML87141.1 heavy metal-associated domain-containing protein [Methylomusa anaerophila]
MADQNTLNRSVFRVGGLKGDHCRERIEHTLSHLHGVVSVKIDLTGKQVSVDYDSSVTPSGYIEETLQSLGYSIQE